ncbi:hypothetical protein GCM10009663_74120 [Kitasatospora arboriphila]|uniref:Uncharacterized protein n=1 Tax=Kitasatospora arboriphila TaxID=258052 RepID=A0ABP4ETC5_9ACTN
MPEPFALLLPVFVLPTCATCGHDTQGTRAKPGGTVRCTRCKTMRRVPMGRPLFGPDDPTATVPHPGPRPKNERTTPRPERPAASTRRKARPARPKPRKAHQA